MMRGSWVYSLIFAVYSSSCFCFGWERDCASGVSPGVAPKTSTKATTKRANGPRNVRAAARVIHPPPKRPREALAYSTIGQKPGRSLAAHLLPSIAMLAHFKLPFGWFELIKRTVKEAIGDDIFSLAAQQAYYFLFSLFPALLTLVAIASFFPVANLTDEVFEYLGRFAPPEVLNIITDQLLKISRSG